MVVTLGMLVYLSLEKMNVGLHLSGGCKKCLMELMQYALRGREMGFNQHVRSTKNCHAVIEDLILGASDKILF